jgi:hypothetical protein
LLAVKRYFVGAEELSQWLQVKIAYYRRPTDQEIARIPPPAGRCPRSTG